MRPFLAVTIAYLLGSIPTGYLIVRAMEGGDIRKTGSGGTGATNVSRRAGKSAGVVTLLFDVLKGVVAMLLAKSLLQVGTITASPQRWWFAVAAIAVVAGHIFPIWLRFRGGKGVATGLGVFLVLSPGALLFAAIVFFIIVLLTRFVSLASIVATLTIPVVTLFLGSASANKAAIIAATCIATLIVFAHRANIQRLRNGTESKFW